MRSAETSESSRGTTVVEHQPDLGASTAFGAQSPTYAMVSSTVVVALIVFFSWVASPEASRNSDRLFEVFADLGKSVGMYGWNLVGVSAALIAVSLTAITIVGFRNANDPSSERRNLIVAVADIFMIAALGFLGGVVAAGFVSYLGAAFAPDPKDQFVPSVAMFFVLAAAIVLWGCTRVMYTYLRVIVQSDDEHLVEERHAVAKLRKHYEYLRESPASQLEKFKCLTKSAKPKYSSRRQVTRALLTSGGLVVASSVVAGIIAWFSSGGNWDSKETWADTFYVLFATFCLAALQLLFVVVSLFWSFQAFQAREPGIKGVLWYSLTIIFSSPIVLLVPLSALPGIFSPDASASLLKRICLALLVFAPSIASIWWPKSMSWIAAANSEALRQIDLRLAALVTREDRLAQSAISSSAVSLKSEAKDGGSDAESQIIALLEQLVLNTRNEPKPPPRTKLLSPSACSLKPFGAVCLRSLGKLRK